MKYQINLTSEQRTKIQETAGNGATSQRMKKRANVLLLADRAVGKPITQQEISARAGVSDVTVYHVLKDFCTHGMEYTLQFKRAKAPNPAIITGDKEARIIALACTDSPEGSSQWSIRLLTKKIIEYGIMEKVSRETVRNVLKKRNLSLGKTNITV